jgi:hypothetical protein
MMMLQVLLKLELAWQLDQLVSEQLLQLGRLLKLVEFEPGQQVQMLQPELALQLALLVLASL